MKNGVLSKTGLAQLWEAISNKFVKRVDGKDLSTNDFTTDYKNKLDGIESGSQVNILESVKVNGEPLVITDKSVNLEISDNNLEELTDDEIDEICS